MDMNLNNLITQPHNSNSLFFVWNFGGVKVVFFVIYMEFLQLIMKVVFSLFFLYKSSD